MIYKIYAESFGVEVIKYDTNSFEEIINNNFQKIDDLDRKKISSFKGIAANATLGFFIKSDEDETETFYLTMNEIDGFNNGEIIEYVSRKDSIILNKTIFSFTEDNLIYIGEFESESFNLFDLKLNDFIIIDTMYFFTSLIYDNKNIFTPEYPYEDANSLYLNNISITNSNGNSVFNLPTINDLKNTIKESDTIDKITFSTDEYYDLTNLQSLIAGYKEYIETISNVEKIIITTENEIFEFNEEIEYEDINNTITISFYIKEININFSTFLIKLSEFSSLYSLLIDFYYNEEEIKKSLIIDSMSCNDNFENQFDLFQNSVSLISNNLIEEEYEDDEEEIEEKKIQNLTLSIIPVAIKKESEDIVQNNKSIFEQLTDKDSYKTMN
jgi:hypothetical protein